mmetsp:Transcript_26716/g.54429  ORF Transcript_26716/g.54429 Transcript_26716/m.54429 type:complete len:294 (+) Transcript_26716:964-1845(+)
MVQIFLKLVDVFQILLVLQVHNSHHVLEPTRDLFELPVLQERDLLGRQLSRARLALPLVDEGHPELSCGVAAPRKFLQVNIAVLRIRLLLLFLVQPHCKHEGWPNKYMAGAEGALHIWASLVLAEGLLDNGRTVERCVITMSELPLPGVAPCVDLFGLIDRGAAEAACGDGTDATGLEGGDDTGDAAGKEVVVAQLALLAAAPRVDALHGRDVLALVLGHESNAVVVATDHLLHLVALECCHVFGHVRRRVMPEPELSAIIAPPRVDLLILQQRDRVAVAAHHVACLAAPHRR